MGDVIFFYKDTENTMESIFEVARFFLKKESMTHLKLQKMCYYAQAWHLAIFESRLVDENFQAWLHGPVCPKLYQQYKQWEWYEISEYTGIVKLCKKTIDFLELVYTVYGSYSGNQLEEFTHSEEPWIKARRGAQGYCTNVISDSDMQSYYKKLLTSQIKTMEEEQKS